MRRSLSFAAAVAVLCAAGAGAASAQVAGDGYYNGVYYHNGAFYRGLVRPEAPVATVTADTAPRRTVTSTTTVPPPARATTVTQDTRAMAVTPTRRAAPAPAATVEHRETVQPRVMGWVSFRPADCGVYRYWNGERCLDAREVPPTLGVE